MRKYPQVLLNVRVAKRFDPLAGPAHRCRWPQEVERRFDGRGRIVLRASGTEPVIRVMVEGYDADLVKQGAREIAGGRGSGTAARAEGPPNPWGLAVSAAARLIFAAFPAGQMPKVALCVVRWSRAIGKCTAPGPPIRALLADLEMQSQGRNGRSTSWSFRPMST